MVKRKEKILYAEVKQKRLLEKLGFVQLVFDFCTGPVDRSASMLEAIIDDLGWSLADFCLVDKEFGCLGKIWMLTTITDRPRRY